MDNRTDVQKSVVSAVLTHVAQAGSGIVSLLSGLLAAFLILYSGFVLYDTFYTQDQAFGNTWELLQYRPEIIEDGAVPLDGTEMLAQINEDYRAWLTIYDTYIDYPVMQGENETYYASHDIYGNSSLTGAIYLSAGNAPDFSDNYNLIYGHHMDNQAMFGCLDNFINTDYFENHREAIIVTSDKVYDVQIFASISTDAYESMIYTTGGDRDLDEIYSYIEEHAYQFDPSVLEGATKIVAMSTCADATTSGRLVVFGVMTERDMEPTPDVPPVDPNDPDDPTPDNPPIDPNDPTAENPYDPTPDNPDNPDEPTPDNPQIEGNPPTVNPDNPDINPDNPDIEVNPGVDVIEPGITIDDEQTPLAQFIARFNPTGDVHRGHAWALVNLIALIVTIYLFLPLLHRRAKYGRRKMMNQVNDAKIELRNLERFYAHQQEDKERIDRQALEDRMTRAEKRKAKKNAVPIDMDAAISEKEFDTAVEELYYRLKKFTRRSRTGYLLELVTSVVALIAFILTEDMRLPMVLIDKWTPLMLILLAICWIIDIRLARYRGKEIEEEREEIEDALNETKEQIGAE